MLSVSTSVLRLLSIYCLLVLQMLYAEHKCMECASSNLKGRWALTGFAQTLPVQSFTAACIAGTDTERYSMCTGYCITYLFQDPDVSSSNPGLMVVRGCQRRLLGMKGPSPTTNNSSATSYCEYDKDLARLNSQGELVNIKALVQFCTGISRQHALATPELVRSFVFRSNAFFVYFFRHLEAVHKSCSDISLYGGEDGCIKSAITDLPGNLMKLNGQMLQCYCSDKDYCNSKAMAAPSVIFAVLSIFQFLVIWC
ncbi:unnamed protein product [Gongylonema pulchrum]|uniref:Protein quiver n=1 Tax=Gongylonema pulchrum TaxID=637853 RepID=A0A183EDS3_9BILA|nr:unnamed protein product [Gongylonema pulchrum]